MTDSISERRERLEMLLIDQAVGQLDESGKREIEVLLREFPELGNDGFDLAAAGMHLAFLSEQPELAGEDLPSGLTETILAAAPAYLERSATAASDSGSSAKLNQTVRGEPDSRSSGTGDAIDRSNIHGFEASSQDATGPGMERNLSSRHRVDPWRWVGWLVATAAIFCLLFLQLAGNGGLGNNEVGASGDDTSKPDELAMLLAEDDTSRYQWAPGPTPVRAGAEGEVVWNQRLQSGLMIISGLPVNDPSVEQYQLWIIDPSRDQHPIDGGVFNIDSTQTSVVAIDAKLRVLDPQAFAITIEKPGGVVVSDQSRLPLIAAVSPK
jgi:hypothetical protein